MADRFAYLPVHRPVFDGRPGWWPTGPKPAKSPAPRLAIPSAIACICWCWGACTYRQVGYWHDIASFWQRTLALTQRQLHCGGQPGIFLFSQGRAEEAAAHFRSALAIRPDDLIANLNLGAYEDSRGNHASRHRALSDGGAARSRHGHAGGSRCQSGVCLSANGGPTTAKRYFETACHVGARPDPCLMIGLGLIAQQNGDLAEAIRQYSHAAAVQSHRCRVLVCWRRLCSRQGGRMRPRRFPGAIADLAEAQKTAEALFRHGRAPRLPDRSRGPLLGGLFSVHIFRCTRRPGDGEFRPRKISGIARSRNGSCRVWRAVSG